MTVKYSAVSKDERDKTEWFCLRLGIISKFYDFIVRIKQFGKHCQIIFFSLRLLYTNCNNVALPYFTFWYLPEISKLKKKIGEDYVVATTCNHTHTCLCTDNVSIHWKMSTKDKDSSYSFFSLFH